jgi:hypothetical protein
VSCGLVGVATNAEKALGESSFAPIFKLWWAVARLGPAVD